jgi:aquaporin Z
MAQANDPRAAAAQPGAAQAPHGKAAFIDSVGGQRAYADWTDPDHRARRLLSEAIGMFGLTFILSGAAAISVKYGDGGSIKGWQMALVLSLLSGVWLLAAIASLGDISAHFNPAMTFAFALRGDMDWVMAGFYWVVQFAAAVAGSVVAQMFAGDGGGLAATHPPSDMLWQAALFEAILTAGLVTLVFNMANGPKLNGPLTPLAVGGYILAFGTMGGPFEGAAMNPARAFGPDVATGDFFGFWVYMVGPLLGAAAAVGISRVLRGPATAREAGAAQGQPLEPLESDRTPPPA